MLNRRGFLGAIAGLVAGATLDPERLLWRPGAKLISIPPPALPTWDIAMPWEEIPISDIAAIFIVAAPPRQRAFNRIQLMQLEALDRAPLNKTKKAGPR